MNKTRIKELQAIAATLPEIKQKRKHAGWWKLKNGAVKAESRIIEEPVNHLRRLKKAFKQKGDLGVKEYLNWVKTISNKYAKTELQTA